MLTDKSLNKHRHKYLYNLNCSYWSMRFRMLVRKSPYNCYMHWYIPLCTHLCSLNHNSSYRNLNMH